MRKIIIVNSNKTKIIEEFLKLLVMNIKIILKTETRVISENVFLNSKDRTNNIVLYLVCSKKIEEIQEISNKSRELALNTIYLSAFDKSLIIGPTYFPGNSASIDSASLFYLNYKLNRIPNYDELLKFKTTRIDKPFSKIDSRIFNKFIQNLIEEINNITFSKVKLNYIDHIGIFSKNKKTQIKYVFPVFENFSYNKEKFILKEVHYDILKNQLSKAKTFFRDRHFFNNIAIDDVYSSVGIIGGGTAGYLTAIALKKKNPELKVTLIESSEIPIIGVGEATTPGIRGFLFNYLGFDEKEFFLEVKPTCKLGIKFDWGAPNTYFNFPFGPTDMLASYINNGDVNSCSLASILMTHDSSLVVGNEEFNESLTEGLSHAYHINNKDFVLYLQKKAEEIGVVRIDDLIEKCEKDKSGERIHIIHGKKSIYNFDFYVDCTGFKSLLLKELSVKYISYSDSLFTDRAITASMPNEGVVKPYTYSETMNHGWCWNTPIRDSDHLGYVFSSKYCNNEQAINELKQKYPEATIGKIVNFKSGRHEKILNGNVYAVGNSYAFIEPLESTGIYMITQEIKTLTDNFCEIKKSTPIRELINESLSKHWDSLRFVLEIHFKYNKKLQTPFWIDCNKNIDFKEYQWVIDLYKKSGPLSYLNGKTEKLIKSKLPKSLFGLSSIDSILMGQNVFPDKIKSELRNKKIWDSQLNIWDKLMENTIPLEEGDQFLTN